MSAPPSSARLGRWVRYGTVSAVCTATSMSVLAALVASQATTAGWANVIATSIGIGPSFELNRRWVWRHDGRRSLAAQVLPFAALTFAGLGLSTAAVSLANRWALEAGLNTGMRTLLAEAANVTAFGSLWLLQFFVLDRLLFKPPSARGDATGSGVMTSSLPVGR
jgi:putative flippase GtrA